MSQRAPIDSAAGLFLVAFSLIPRTAFAQVHHIQPAPIDQVAKCVESLWGKHALFVGDDISQLKFECPKEHPELLSSILETADYLAIRNGDWVLLIARRLHAHPMQTGDGRRIVTRPWKDFQVEVRIANSETCKEKLTQEQLEKLEKVLTRESRFIPVDSLGDSLFKETALISFHYTVYVEHLKLGAPPSVVVLLTQEQGEGYGRLIYGEITGDSIHLIWDSPVIKMSMPPPPSFELHFLDVDGDGWEEIVAQWKYYLRPTELEAITIFNRSGIEMTRQDCGIYWNENTYGNMACPIAGASVAMDCTSLPCPVSSSSMADDSHDDLSPTGKFKLVNNHYELQNPPAVAVRKKLPPLHRESSAAPSATILNEEGMRLMRARNYDAAAVKFVQAAQLDPISALIANNMGFAYFKMERYEESAVWFKRAIELDPTRAIAYLNLGDALSKQNRNAEARQTYTKYLELAPTSKSASDVKAKLAALPTSP